LTATSSTGFSFLISLSDSFQRAIDLALDLEGELVWIDVERDAGEVIAHEERVVRRDRPVVENAERRLDLRRPAGQADHRTLLRVFHQRPFAVVERQRHGVLRQCAYRIETGGDGREAGALHQLSSVEHFLDFLRSVVVTAGLHRTHVRMFRIGGLGVNSCFRRCEVVVALQPWQARPRPLFATGAYSNLGERRFDQYPQTLTVRRR